MNFLKKTIGRRKQLFEIQDFAWCPKAVRDGVTDLLVLNFKILPLYEAAIPWLSKLAETTDGRWVDLCAGAGGGSILLMKRIPKQIKQLTLTDLYPHGLLDNELEGVTYYPQPVDASNVPLTLEGFRTLFTSFHHLNDRVALDVLINAKNTNTPIGVFEFTDRSLYCLILMLPSFLTSFFLIPFVRPWRLSRFFWTYIIPMIPVVTLLDVLLSCFRTRSEDELNELVSKIPSDNYHWEVGRLPTHVGLSITYLVGYPTNLKD